MEKLDKKGYFTFVQNNATTDYLRLAYLQALSIKRTQKINNYCIAVDEETKKEITNKHKKVFDYIVDIEVDNSKDDALKYRNEWKAWWLTPFKETVKLESDILFTRNIDHWWAGMQQKDICCTTKILDYEGNVSDSTVYRKLFVDNNLPMVYNGFTYFRYSLISQKFYRYVCDLTLNWNFVKTSILKNCRDEYPTTDVLYALAAKMLGEEYCTNPGLDYPAFAHMKSAINRLPADSDWTEKFYCQVDFKFNVTLGFNRQLYPIHYYIKDFASDEIIQKYESEIRI